MTVDTFRRPGPQKEVLSFSYLPITLERRVICVVRLMLSVEATVCGEAIVDHHPSDHLPVVGSFLLEHPPVPESDGRAQPCAGEILGNLAKSGTHWIAMWLVGVEW